MTCLETFGCSASSSIVPLSILAVLRLLLLIKLLGIYALNGGYVGHLTDGVNFNGLLGLLGLLVLNYDLLAR